MLKKMNEKKNNKGFSLVELIVVILIMAVLAVAVAPQVMKWVNNARIASDASNVDAIVSAIQIYETKEAPDKDFSITSGNPGAWTLSGEDGTVDGGLGGILGNDWKSKLATKAGQYTINVNGGVVSAPAIQSMDR